MSKFRNLFENLLTEYDRDDPTDNFYQAAKDYKQNQLEKEKLYTKSINPLQKNDFVYIKAVFVNTTTYKTSIYYISNSQPNSPYVQEKEKATKFSVKDGEAFIKKYPKQIVKNKTSEFERHFELEKI